MRKKWLAILSALAVIFAGAGVYLGTNPEWTRQTYYDYYNEARSMYLEGKTEESSARLTYIAGNTKDAWLKSLALSQLGYIVGRQALDERFPAEFRYQVSQYAIGIFAEAVINNPNNEEAKYNLELLLNQLPNLLQQMEEEKNNNSGNEKNSGPGYSHGSGRKGF